MIQLTLDFSIALNRVTLEEEFSDDQLAVLNGLGTVTLGGMPDNIPLTGRSITTQNVLFHTHKGDNVPAYYTVPVDSWNFAGSNGTGSPLTILDSGTTLIYAPDSVAAAFNDQIWPTPTYNDTLGAYVVECDAWIPDLSVTIAGEDFAFTREDLVYADEGDYCLSSVVPGGNSTDDVFIL